MKNTTYLFELFCGSDYNMVGGYFPKKNLSCHARVFKQEHDLYLA